MIFDLDNPEHAASARKYMAQAAVMAAQSADPSTKVGAVIVDRIGGSHKAISAGCNKLLPDLGDTDDIYADRQSRYDFTVHAEFNTILDALEKGIPVRGRTMFIASAPGGLFPCKECAKFVARVGIRELHIVKPGPDAPARWTECWAESNAAAARVFRRAGVRVCEWDPS